MEIAGCHKVSTNNIIVDRCFRQNYKLKILSFILKNLKHVIFKI